VTGKLRAQKRHLSCHTHLHTSPPTDLLFITDLRIFWEKRKKENRSLARPNIGSKNRGLAWATFRKGLQYRTTNLSFVV
jgi:hypothetical protein